MNGPGRYDAECAALMEATGAAGVVAVVVGGSKGNAFEVHTSDPQFIADLPDLLETIARQMRADIGASAVPNADPVIADADAAKAHALELFAWVGEDELGSGTHGLKAGMTPLGLIPLVSVRREHIDRDEVTTQLQAQATHFRKTISLARFVCAGVVKRITPRLN